MKEVFAEVRSSSRCADHALTDRVRFGGFSGSTHDVDAFSDECRVERDGEPGVSVTQTRTGSTAVSVGRFHDRPGSGGQSPPRVRVAMAMSASGLW
jgi:hypothetical protein